MEHRILLTGFEAFEQEPLNPSWEAVRALEGWQCDAADGTAGVVVARELPCVFGAALEVLAQAITQLKPVLIICVGQAGGRSHMSVERVAINLDDARIADNRGAQPIDQPVHASGPAAYFSTLPIKRMVRAINAVGVPAAVSNSAGTFVCNHVFYGLMHQLAVNGSATRGGFIHIPYLPSQAVQHPGAASMALDSIIAGLRAALQAAIVPGDDIVESGGQLH